MPKKAAPSGEVRAVWQVTCKHSRTGMQFKGYVSEEKFREVQRVLFGAHELFDDVNEVPLDVKG